MSQVDHIDSIGFSTAFSLDKICGVYSSSFTGASTTLLSGVAGGSDLYQHIIPHSFTRPVMCDTLASSDGGVTFSPLLALTYSDSSNLYINVIDNTKNYTYKMVCTWIDDYDATNPLVQPVLETTSSAYFDSRKNYPKILDVDSFNLTSSGSSHSVAYSNSGRASNVKAYFESKPGQVWPMINGGSQDIWLNDPSVQYELTANIGTSDVLFTYSSGGSSAATAKVWYKIYYEH